MPLPNWTIELIRRSLNEVAEKAKQPETLEKLKSQATDLLGEFPETAARGIDAVMRGAQAGRVSVERWARKHVEVATPMLNASGTLVTPWGTGVAMAAEVSQLGIELMAGDTLSGEILGERLNQRLHQQAGKIDASKGINPLRDDLSIAVASSFESAVASIAAFTASRTLVVHRSDAIRLPGGKNLPTMLSVIGVPVAGLRSPVMEVGSADHRAESDFEEIENACIVTTQTDQPAWRLDGLGDANVIKVVVLPLATIKPWKFDTLSADREPNAQSALAGGADLVILPGDGLLGGPTSGLILGRSSLVDTLCGCSAWPALAASPAITGMVIRAIEVDLSNHLASPIAKLASVSAENLSSRCGRLAVRLGALDFIGDCQTTAKEASLDSSSGWRIPSHQVQLAHVSKTSEDWASQLREESPALICGYCDQFVKIDLRWIEASADGKIAQQIERVR